MGIGAIGYAGMWNGPGAGGGGVSQLDLGAVNGCRAVYMSATQIQITPGECRDDTDSEDMIVPGTLTILITATGANGRNVDTAEQADKWYAI